MSKRGCYKYVPPDHSAASDEYYVSFVKRLKLILVRSLLRQNPAVSRQFKQYQAQFIGWFIQYLKIVIIRDCCLLCKIMLFKRQNVYG